MRRLLFHLSRLTVGGLFLYAGALKVVDLDTFAGNVAAYQLLPFAYNYLVAAILPFVEIIAGVLLVFNSQVRPAALLLGGLNLVFMVALVSLMARGLAVDCGCFDQTGRGEPTPPEVALLRDLGIMVLILILYGWHPRPRHDRRAF